MNNQIFQGILAQQGQRRPDAGSPGIPGTHVCDNSYWEPNLGSAQWVPSANGGNGAWKKVSLGDRYLEIRPIGTWANGLRPTGFYVELYTGPEYLVNADPTAAVLDIADTDTTSINGSPNAGLTTWEETVVYQSPVTWFFGEDLGRVSLQLGGSDYRNYDPEIRCISYYY